MSPARWSHLVTGVKVGEAAVLSMKVNQDVTLQTSSSNLFGLIRQFGLGPPVRIKSFRPSIK